MPQPNDMPEPNLSRPAGDGGLMEASYLAGRQETARVASVERWRGVLQQEAQPQADPAAQAGKGMKPGQDQQGGMGVGEYAAKTVTDIPLQTLGALRDATQGVIDTGRGVAEALQNIGIPDAYIQITNPETGELDFDLLTPEGAKAKGLQPWTLPGVAPAKTGVSHFYRKLMQFVLPFSRVSKLVAATGVGTSIGKVGVDLTAGAITDLTFWEAQESRLSDLVQSVPALQNPVTEFLARNEDDPIILDKMKIALEGVGMGAIFHGLAAGLRHLRAARAAHRAAAEVKKAGVDIDLIARQADQVDDDLARSVLGSADEPPVKFTSLSPDEIKAANDAAGSMDMLYRAGDDLADAADVQIAGMPGEKAAVPRGTSGRPVINFRTIDAPEDVDGVLREMTARLQDTATQAARGPISHAETAALAKKVGIKELLDPAVDVSRFNRAELVALKDLYVASGEKLLQTADAAVSAPTTANLWAFRKMLATHNEIYGRFVGAKAEAGRALNALAIPAKAGNVERLGMIQNMLDDMGGEAVAKDLAERIASLRHATPEAITEVARRSVWARTGDAVQEAWVLGLVSGPQSQARNILSNAAYMYQSIAERGLAARLPGSTVQKGEAAAYAFGTLQSMKQAFINAGKTFKTGVTGYGVGKLEMPYRKAISGEALGLRGPMGYLADGVGGFYRLFGRMLSSGDEFFKTLNYNGELWAQAVRKAPQGLPADEFAAAVTRAAMDPDEAARIAATQAANYATFTARLGPAGQTIQKLAHEYPPLRFLVPFIRTPGNIFKAGFARSPAAIFMPETFWAAVKAGGADRDLALARVALGSTAMALFADVTMRGYITGRGPLDPAERARLRDTGWEPYSINIGAIQGGPDHWINYRAIEPIGMVLGLAADTTELMMQYSELTDSDNPEDEARAERLAWAAVAAVGNSVTSQTFMRGASDFFTMMSNPEMYAENWLQNYARTALPRLSAGIERQVDPELREVYSLMDAIRADTPGLSDDLEPRLNTWGRPIIPSGSLGPDWLSPIWMSDKTGTPIAKELVDQGIRLKKPGKTVSFQDDVFGINVPISLRDYPKAYTRYLQLQGHELKHPAFGLGAEDLMNQIIEGKHYLSDVYRQLPDGDENGIEDKGKFVKDIMGEYRQMAKRQVLEEFPELRDEVRRRAQRKYKLLTER